MAVSPRHRSTAYIGSSSLSRGALLDGLEWNVRVAALEQPHLIETFSATFAKYWDDPAFEEYEPCRDADRFERAIAMERDGPVDLSLELTPFAVRPFGYQEEILDTLAAERHLHGRWRNLVVAAAGTDKTVMAALDHAVCAPRPRRAVAVRRAPQGVVAPVAVDLPPRAAPRTSTGAKPAAGRGCAATRASTRAPARARRRAPRPGDRSPAPRRRPRAARALRHLDPRPSDPRGGRAPPPRRAARGHAPLRALGTGHALDRAGRTPASARAQPRPRRGARPGTRTPRPANHPHAPAPPATGRCTSTPTTAATRRSPGSAWTTPRRCAKACGTSPTNAPTCSSSPCARARVTTRPTTRYNDHALTPELFHWESQSTTPADSKTGQRYINLKREGTSVHLFCASPRPAPSGAALPVRRHRLLRLARGRAADENYLAAAYLAPPELFHIAKVAAG